MDVFIARQPIFDRKRDVFGYELLFRSGLQNYFDHFDADKAASQMIGDSAIFFGIETLTRGKKAFINLTRDSLMKDYPSLLPRDIAVLELLETIEPDEEVLNAVRKLKRKGYTLALDDFVYHPGFDPLIQLVDIIKVDWMNSNEEERRNLFKRFSVGGKTFLAEKLETQEDFEEAYSIGYHLFQGYFFSKPVVISKKEVSGNKLTTLKVLREIHQPGLDFQNLDECIRQDLTLSYKLLRYINSAFFGLHTEIRSIKHALVLMGESEIRKWATLVSLATMGEDKPLELTLNATLRAKMCEVIATETGQKNPSDFFLMGLFSVIDAIMDRNLVEVLHDLPLAREVKSALLRVGANPYRQVYEIVLSYEYANWRALTKWTQKLGIDEMRISDIYMESIDWAHNSQK
ncbi:MAG: HDOD domain-containing protein [Acidobacteriota bacterium]|nr:HDOD domain-containing protein [Acidobacteriota bacterium]